MKAVLSALAMTAALVATDASAQGVNLSGQYRCVERCADGLVGTPTAVNQIGFDMNLVNEVGQVSRGWMEGPGRIWLERWQQSAVYSADGMAIRFESGTVWQRDVGQFDVIVAQPRLQPPVRGRRVVVPAAPPVRQAVRSDAFDGSWSVVIVTESGPCDRAYRYAVQINNGYVSSDAGPVSLQGRVAPNGAVRVSVSAAGNRADGQGRLSANAGGGTWHGEGAGATCAGTWQAERRG